MIQFNNSPAIIAGGSFVQVQGGRRGMSMNLNGLLHNDSSWLLTTT